MWKGLLVASTALTLLGGSIAFAQQTPPVQAGGDTVRQRAHLTPEQRAARTEQRIVELKTVLELKPAQEKHWATFETALRNTAKARTARFEQIRSSREQAGPGRDSRAETTPAEVAEQKQLAAALDPLYQSFDQGQKDRFASLFRVDGEGRHFWFRGGRRQNERS